MPAQSSFDVIFVVVGVLVVAGVALTIALFVRNVRAYRRSGLDPMTADADLAVRLMRSEALAPQRSIGDRLAELDQLRRDGAISEEEHRAARHAVLTGSRADGTTDTP